MKRIESWFLTRRSFLATASALPIAACSPAAPSENSESALRLGEVFSRIEAVSDGRIGVAALDMATGQTLGHRQDERFAMCSSFKWLLAAMILLRVDRGEERLDRMIAYTPDDLVFYSPITQDHTGSGMTIADLCSATVRTSDNTAANLLLATLGGPQGFTAMVRATGDTVTRLDRLEPQLNENRPGDPQDTTTPAAMADSMQRILFGDVLGDASKTLLQGWMIAATTGYNRLRAGISDGWTVGDKTGTSSNDQSNDVAFAVYPGREPILIVSYLNVPDPTGSTTDALHAAIARLVMHSFDVD